MDDVRESPSFELIERLEALGAEVDYHDPHVARTPSMRHYSVDKTSIDLTDAALADYDAVLVSTNHVAYDWANIAARAKLIVDTRNALRDHPGDHIIKA